MIHVAHPAAPGNYDADVRLRGAAFLATTPHPLSADWKAHRYWSAIHDYLHTELKGICSYCATFTPRRRSASSIDHTSIDHYTPKSIPPHTQAYEWNNFRLARARLNHRKGDFRNVLDPCAVVNGWFRLSFTTFNLYPDRTQTAAIQKQVQDTINQLELNRDDGYVTERARAVYGYADRKLLMPELTRMYPFIASEMVAQDFDNVHLPRFAAQLARPQIRQVLIRQGWMS